MLSPKKIFLLIKKKSLLNFFFSPDKFQNSPNSPYNRISTSNRNFRVVANVNRVHLFHIISPISFFIRNELSTASIKLDHVWFKQKIDFWLNFEHFLTSIIYLLPNEALHILFSPFWHYSTEQQMTAEFLFSDCKFLPCNCKMTHTRDF